MQNNTKNLQNNPSKEPSEEKVLKDLQRNLLLGVHLQLFCSSVAFRRVV